MVAALLVCIVCAALFEFFVSYCHYLLAASSKRELSLDVREVTGIETCAAPGDEFTRIFRLANLCPARRGGNAGSLAVGAYHRMLRLLQGASRHIAPCLADWGERERARCSYFAAGMLDRRMAYSRGLWAEQMAEGPHNATAIPLQFLEQRPTFKDLHKSACSPRARVR
jgi:hypothetical protein